MYGISQAGLIVHQLLEKTLNKKGYHQSRITPGFWTQERRLICFSLCVDDFGVKYVGKTRGAPHDSPQRALQNIERLEGQKTPRYGSRLGLQKPQGAPVNDGVMWQNPSLDSVTKTHAHCRISHNCTSSKIMTQMPSMLKRQTSLHPSVKKICFPPGSHGYPVILCKGSGSNHTYITRIYQGTPSQPDRETM